MWPARYAVPASRRRILDRGDRLIFRERLGVTFCQFAPLSRVTCTSPSSEPVQITSFSSRDGVSANTVP